MLNFYYKNANSSRKIEENRCSNYFFEITTITTNFCSIMIIPRKIGKNCCSNFQSQITTFTCNYYKLLQACSKRTNVLLQNYYKLLQITTRKIIITVNTACSNAV